jgi:hypothetical protein
MIAAHPRAQSPRRVIGRMRCAPLRVQLLPERLEFLTTIMMDNRVVNHGTRGAFRLISAYAQRSSLWATPYFGTRLVEDRAGPTHA